MRYVRYDIMLIYVVHNVRIRNLSKTIISTWTNTILGCIDLIWLSLLTIHATRRLTAFGQIQPLVMRKSDPDRGHHKHYPAAPSKRLAQICNRRRAIETSIVIMAGHKVSP